MKFILLALFIISCSGGQTTDANNSSGGGGMIDLIKQQAESEQGKKAIETIKEKMKDPKTQEKIKGLIGGSKTAPAAPATPTP